MRSVLKRLTAVVCAGIMLFAVLSFGFVGCGDADQKKAKELQIENEEQIAALREYFDDQILTLKKAYQLKLISYDDLLSIAYYHNNGIEHNEKVMSENFKPQAKTPEKLGYEYTELLIKHVEKEVRLKYPEEDYYRKNGEDADYERYIANGLRCVEIAEYYGIYNGCIAMVYCDFGIHSGGGDVRLNNIDGVAVKETSDTLNVVIWVLKELPKTSVL